MVARQSSVLALATETNGARFGTDLLTVEGLPAFANTGGALTLDAEYRIGDSAVPGAG